MENPIIEPPAIPCSPVFAIRFLWRDATSGISCGSGIRKQGGRVLLYRSKICAMGVSASSGSGKWTGRESTNPVDSGEMWECPDFFPLGSKHVLLYSTAEK